MYFLRRNIFLYTKQDYIDPIRRDGLEDFWYVYKYTNYSEKVFLGRMHGHEYNFFQDKINAMVNKNTDTSKKEYLDMEFEMWISSNGLRIRRDILDEPDQRMSTPSNSSSTVLFTVIKSIVFEIELQMKYRELQDKFQPIYHR